MVPLANKSVDDYSKIEKLQNKVENKKTN